MKTEVRAGAVLQAALAERLGELLASIPWLHGERVERSAAADRDPDIRAVLPLPGAGTAELWVRCKADPRPSRLLLTGGVSEGAAPQGGPVIVPILAAPFVSERVAQVCWEQGWSWYDLAGNCRLSVPGAIYLERTGHAPVHEHPRATANLGTLAAARVVRALLVPENAHRRWTQTELQRSCQPAVSIGLVNKLVRYLREEAYIDAVAGGGFRLRDPQGLLAAWQRAYRADRDVRRDYFTLLHGRPLHSALARLGHLTGGRAAYAAFSAADFQAPHVRQPKTWLYIGADCEGVLEGVLDAKVVDSGGNLVVLLPPDDGVFYLPDAAGDRLPCTNAVQTYVDLCHAGGRGEEAAQALLQQKLLPNWKAQE